MTTTRKRYDKFSTEFGLWLREQREIDSSLGYLTTNLDYIWVNYKTHDWMLLEEKRHGAIVRLWQQQIFNHLDKFLQSDNHYKGFHKIVFQNTNPEDGYIWLDGISITKAELLEFLQFKTIGNLRDP